MLTCLRVRDGERVTLITDEESLPIGAALHEQFAAAGASVETFVLEDLGARPLKEFPAAAAAALRRSQVSCFAASAQPGELAIRIAMTAVVNEAKVRHAHMVNITPRIMVEGMRADFGRVDALSRWVLERARVARRLTASTPGGTRLEATFDPRLKWLKTSGITAESGPAPGGEVLTALRARASVADGVLATGWLSTATCAITAHGHHQELASQEARCVGGRRDFLAYKIPIRTATASARSRSDNLACAASSADPQDENRDCVAFGHPTANTGADWRSTTHIDIVGRHFDVELDGVPIMRDSRYLVDPDHLS